MTWSIRQARADDADAIATLNQLVQSLHYDHRPDWFKPPNADAFLSTVRSWLGSDHVAVFVCEDASGGSAGYAVGIRHQRPDHALLHAATVVELDQLVVVPSARNQGVGTALSEHIIRWAEGVGADRVELTVWQFNHSAYRLFAELGFAPTTTRMCRSVAEPR